MQISFLFLNENICCGYSLEAPRWGASNEYHNICFHWEIRKILCGYPLLSVAMYLDLTGHLLSLISILIIHLSLLAMTKPNDPYPLSTWRFLRSFAMHRMSSKDCDQTVHVCRLIWVFTGHTWLKMHFLILCFYGFMDKLKKHLSCSINPCHAE